MDWDTQERLEQRASQVVENTRGLVEDLTSVRKEHGLSQSELAERMGVSQSAVAQFERYDANPTIASVERYAIAVGARIAITVVSDRDQWVPRRAVHLRDSEHARVKARSSGVGVCASASAWSEPAVTEVTPA